MRVGVGVGLSGGRKSPPPVASFASDYAPGATTATTIHFTDTSSPPASSWNWEKNLNGGGWTAMSTAKNPSATFAVGSWQVRLTVNGGSQSLGSAFTILAAGSGALLTGSSVDPSVNSWIATGATLTQIVYGGVYSIYADTPGSITDLVNGGKPGNGTVTVPVADIAAGHAVTLNGLTLSACNANAVTTIEGTLTLSGNGLASGGGSSGLNIPNLTTLSGTLDLSSNSLTTDPFGSGLVASGSILMQINQLDTAAVNSILARCVAGGQSNGTVNLSGQTPSAPPSGQGVADVATLQGLGWTVTTD